jgi:hypothetical protein
MPDFQDDVVCQQGLERSRSRYIEIANAAKMSNAKMRARMIAYQPAQTAETADGIAMTNPHMTPIPPDHERAKIPTTKD